MSNLRFIFSCRDAHSSPSPAQLFSLSFVLLALVVAPAWGIGPGQPFEDGVTFEIDTRDIALGDVDGDGDMDAVEAKDDGLNRLYLNTAGVFGEAIVVDTVASDSRSLALADMDGDGDLDLLVANVNGATSRIHLNDGFGTFDSGTDISSDTDTTVSIAVGDVNGDGFQDVLAGNSAQENVIYLGDGTGSFNSGMDTDTTARNTTAVVLADLNGDGNLDIVESSSNQTDRWYAGNGLGGFGTGTALEGSQYNSQALLVVDLEGDGDLDVVIGVDGDDDVVYLNNGALSPVFAFSDLNNSATTRALAAADIGGAAVVGGPDGNLDIVVGISNGPVTVHFGDGIGGFGGLAPDISIPNTNLTRSLAAVDVNGDLIADIVEGNILENVGNRVYLNNGNDTFDTLPIHSFTHDNRDRRGLTLVDLNADGFLDLVEAKRDASTRIRLGTVSEGFEEAVPIGGILGTNGIATGDMDGDGDIDVLTGNGGAVNRLYRNQLSGNPPGAPLEFNTGSDISADVETTRAIAVGNLDGGTDLEVVVANSGGINRMFTNNGFGNFSAGDVFDNEVFNSWAVALGDLDGDLDLDIVFGNASPNRVHFNNGMGVFGAGVDLSADDHTTKAVALGDLNGDTMLDVVVGNDLGGPNRVYFNLGGGTFTAGANLGTDLLNTTSIAIIDADSDGDLDVVAGSGTANRLYVNIDAAGTFSAGVDIGGGSDSNNTTAIVLADINGSGVPDLIVGNDGGYNKLNLNGNPTTTGLADVNVTEDDVPTDIDLFAAFEDRDDADTVLIYQVSSNSNPALVSDSVDGGTGTLTLSYLADQNGTADLVVRATDTDGLFAEASFTVNVAADSDSPVSTPIAAQNGTAGVPFNLDISGNFSDADGDALTFSATGLPTSLAIGDPATGVIAGTPSVGDVAGSPYTVTVTANSGVGGEIAAMEMFQLTLAASPDTTAPVITLLGDAAVTVTQPDGYVDAGATALDDVDGDITSLIVATGAADPDTVGVYIITYDVMDAAGNAALPISRTVTVVAAPAPNPNPTPTPPPVNTGGGGGASGPLALFSLLLGVFARRRRPFGVANAQHR